MIDIENMEEVAKNSLINCHTVGLDSIMFQETEHQSVRLFIARKNHDMWKNTWGHTYSIGLHPHHRDITIIPLQGTVANVELCREGATEKFHCYNYESPIIGESAGGFKKLEGVYELGLTSKLLKYPTFMPATMLHSVWVPKGESASWYVIGGKENPHHRGVTYSNDPALESFDFGKLYQPMSVKYLRNLLSEYVVNL